MKSTYRFLTFLSLLLAVSWLAGCGSSGTSTGTSSGGGTGSSSGVSVDGTVSLPTTTSTSVSLGQSVDGLGVGKGLGSGNGNARIIVSKAITETTVNSGDCTAKLLDGTRLDEGDVSNGTIRGLVIDPARLDSTKQVVIEVETGGKKVSTLVDLTSKVTGDTASAGTINPDSTLAAQQVYNACDSSATIDSPTASCIAKIASGEIKPLALFKTFKNVFDVSSSAGSSDAATGYQALRKAFQAAFVSGTPPSFSDINTALQGGGILNTWKNTAVQFGALDAGIDMGTAIGHIQQYIPAVRETFKDATTFNKYVQVGDTGWANCAQFFGKKTGDDLKLDKDRPEIGRGFILQKANSFIAGDTSAFNTMRKAGVARVMAQMAGQAGSTTFSSAQYEALEDLIDSKASSFDTLGASNFAAMGASFFQQMRAADTAAEIALMKQNPGAFAQKMFDNPALGSGGFGVFDSMFVTFKQNEAAFINPNAKGCDADADCPSGRVCTKFDGSNGMCFESCTSNCGMGSKCSSNGQCASGFCSSNGACAPAAGVDALAGALKVGGDSCTAASECFSGNCSSGTCVAPAVTGQAAYAGLYKKTNGQNPTCNINFQIDSPPGASSAFFSIQPVNINSPTDNTFYGGGITLSGSGPFTIASGTIGGPGASSGTITCDGSGDSTVLTLSGSRLTGTCALTTISGTAYVATCTIDHTKL